MNDKFYLKNQRFIIIGLAVIGLLLIILLYLIFLYEKKIERDIFYISTSDVLAIANNKARSIQNLLKNSDDYVKSIKNSRLLQKKIENSIITLVTENIKYSYLLYKDKKDIFRFLVDASNVGDKAFLNQKFDVGSSKWFELYKEKKPMVIRHDILQKLSLTYLVPILNKDKVSLVLVIDYSISKSENINHIIDLLKKTIFFIIFIKLVFFISLIIQIIKYRSIKESSFIDKLTKVFNRNYLYEIEKNIDLKNYIVAALDIDYFKRINDNYGHDVGDIILEEVGSIILNTLRKKEDIVIRYGGEEFILLIQNAKNRDDIPLSVLHRIFNNIKKKKMFINEEDFIHITVSMGINKQPHKSKNFAEAFKLTDIALYDAKNSGRDKIVIYEESTKTI